MTRTHIDLDDVLVAEVMRRFALSTKKDAVHLALTRLVGQPVDREFVLSLEGTGRGDDGLELADLRDRPPASI